jgi:cytochrome c553
MKFRPTLLALGVAVTAIVATTAQAEGNVADGKTRVYTCQGCHGIANYKNQYPSYSVPKLGGQNPKYIENALKAYASGERSHPTMFSQATGMTDQVRADIASFLHGEPTEPTGQVVGTPPPATQTCVACHGADGAKTVSEDYPKLAGQQADYIVHALQDYKSGKRKNPVMAGVVAGVDAKDFEAIAQFFSQQKGLCTTDVIAKHGKCE